MRRKLSFLLLILILLSSAGITAYAAGTVNYTVDELNMSIDFPDDLVVFTRDTDENDPNLAAYGLTHESMLSMMTSGSIYLNAIDKDSSYEFVITMTSVAIKDFNAYTDEELSELAANLSSEYESIGATYIRSEVYQHMQTKFLKIYISQPVGNITAYGLQYYTVYDYKAINITLQSYSGEITPAHEAEIKSVVDSAVFGISSQAEDSETTPAGTPALAGTTDSSDTAVTDNLDAAEDGDTGKSSARDYTIENILLSLLITVAIYSLPIILYRYAVKREPVEPKKAQKITVIYGIVAFLVMCALIYYLGGSMTSGGAVVFWGFINYRILVGGHKKAEEFMQDRYVSERLSRLSDNVTPMHDSQDQFCRMCGIKLTQGDAFCVRCGAATIPEKRDK